MTDWKRIVEEHGGLVWATAFRLVGNGEDAADCFQEAFLEAVKVSRKEPVGDWSAFYDIWPRFGRSICCEFAAGIATGWMRCRFG